jgi:hypothetical protein
MPNNKIQFYQNINDTSIDSDNKSNKRRRSRGERTNKTKKGGQIISFRLEQNELIPNILIPEAEPTPTKPELINIIDEDPMESKQSSLRKDFCTPLKQNIRSFECPGDEYLSAFKTPN